MKVTFDNHRLVNPKKVEVDYLTGHGGPDMWIDRVSFPYDLNPATPVKDLEHGWRVRVLNAGLLGRTTGGALGRMLYFEEMCRSCPGSDFRDDPDAYLPGDIVAWPHLLVPIRLTVLHQPRRRATWEVVRERPLPNTSRYVAGRQLMNDLRSDYSDQACDMKQRLQRETSNLIRPLLVELTPEAIEVAAKLDAADAAAAAEAAASHLSAAEAFLGRRDS